MDSAPQPTDTRPEQPDTFKGIPSILEIVFRDAIKAYDVLLEIDAVRREGSDSYLDNTVAMKHAETDQVNAYLRMLTQALSKIPHELEVLPLVRKINVFEEGDENLQIVSRMEGNVYIPYLSETYIEPKPRNNNQELYDRDLLFLTRLQSCFEEIMARFDVAEQ